MKKTDTLVEQKSMLAKLMAAENITVEHRKIPTAAFDVKNRVLLLPILKWKPGTDVYDLFCAHEVGHALWTPFEGWHSSISEKGKGFKSFLNVIEDARIEKKIKRKFAGARKCMIGGYKELLNEDFFGLRKMGMSPNDLSLIDRINLYTKAGTDYEIDFTEEEREWVEKVMRTETFEDVIQVTNDLYEYCKENESDTDNSYGEFGEDDEESDWNDDYEPNDFEDSIREEMMKDMLGDDSDEDDSEKGAAGSGSGDDDSDEDGSAGGKSSGKSPKEGESGKEDSDNSNNKSEGSETSNGRKGGHGNLFGDRKPSGPTSMTDDNFRENEEEMSDMSDSVTIPKYCTFPKINMDAVVIDYKKVHTELTSYYNDREATEVGMKLLKKFKTTNNKMISYMVKEFEMKKAADIHRRAYTSKKGTLDMNKIHAYKYSENLFQQITSFPEGKNHGMVMFIDWSGSMHSYMKDTIEKLINLTMFCSKVQIPFEVYSFSDHYRDWKDEHNSQIFNRQDLYPYDVNHLGKKIANYKTNELTVHKSTKLINLFSSKMRNRDLTEAYKNLLLISEAFDTRYNYYNYRSTDYYGTPENFSLGGTPLDDAIVMSKTVIEEFKIKSRTQIVNAIFLTDGQSNNSGGFLDSDNMVRHHNRRTLHVDDKISRTRTYPKREGRQLQTTDILLEALKKSLGINLLGFFLTSGGGKRTASNISDVMFDYATEEQVNKFRKEKFLIETKSSYDELYIIKTKGLEIDEVNYIEKVEVGSSKAELRRALKKNTKNKLQNRVLLNAFIAKVA
jgi:hypothetical protein